jgi:branched-chain amino acid aminotransferase
MRDVQGNVAEGAGCRVFFVAGGVVYTPARDFVLAVISRREVLELCVALHITCIEGTGPDALAMTADEAFFTSTSLYICPLASLDAQTYPVPGPVTARLMQAFSNLVGMDFAAQYLRFLSDRPASTGL